MKAAWRWLGAVVLAAGLALAAQADEPMPHWTISGTSILGPDGAPVRLRGFNVNWWVPPTAQDAKDIHALGANCVRYMFGYEAKGKYDPAQIAEVEEQIRCFTREGLWVIPVLYIFERPDPADPKKKLGPWSNSEMNEEFFAMWTDVVNRLRNEPHVAAWEPLNEPHDTPPELVAAWYRDLLPKWRKLDAVRPIVVEGANYSHAEDLTDVFKMDDPNIIYAFHFYDPYEYTTDLKNPPLVYPGVCAKSDLAKKIDAAVQFRTRHNVPVWCGEYGVKTGAPGYQQWLRDTCDILEANHFDWCIWSWALQPKDPLNTTFDINTQKKDAYQLVLDLFRDVRNESNARE